MQGKRRTFGERQAKVKMNSVLRLFIEDTNTYPQLGKQEAKCLQWADYQRKAFHQFAWITHTGARA